MLAELKGVHLGLSKAAALGEYDLRTSAYQFAVHDAMRNIFDQFEHRENRLTHALMCCLHEDRRLLKSFVQWATGERAPAATLLVLEQHLPGEEEASDLEEVEGRGLPDGWIHDGDGWALVIESKISCPLEADQLRRHRLTAQKRGFTRLHLLALVAESPSGTIAVEATIRRWTDLYRWLKKQESKSEWARRLINYMEVLEVKLSKEQYLKEGTLTVFTGIPFGRE